MVKLAAEKRTILGKKVAGLRADGFLPAVLYGKGAESHPLSVRMPDFLKVLKSAGESTLVDLEVTGAGTHSVIIHEVGYDPVLSKPIHVDFLEVATDKLLKTHVPIEFVGESEAVKSLGGALVRVMHEIEVEALPKNLPHTIHVDISVLNAFGDKITLADLKIPADVKVHGDPAALVVKVDAPRAVEEEVPAAEINLEDIAVVEKGKKKEPSEEGAADDQEA